ncbi:MAG: ABC transporter permease [Steroidobacteraceae bacterium]
MFTVFVKEFRENLRDRRTVMTALLFGPVFGPVFFAAMLQFSLDRSRLGSDETVEVTVMQPQNAPHLIAWLESQRIVMHPVTGDAAAARRAIAEQRARVVLEIPAQFGDQLGAGKPAVLRLYADSSRTGDERYSRRLATAISQYSQQIASQRLALRGIDGQQLTPIAVQDVDVATPAARALLVLGMLSFFIILSLLTGGMYLAIDTTVGERERGTLEPLLATPVPREALLLGKLMATCSYMMLSMAMTTVALCATLSRIDLEQFGMSANLGPRTALTIIAVTAPLIPFLATAMTLIAAWTRSAREAQAWLGVLQLVPTLPLVFASLMNLSATLPLMAVPSLSQHLLITRILRAEGLDGVQLTVSVVSSILLGALLALAAARIYRRESLLI